MDSRLVMVVVMVAVACLSPGAKAQNTTSAMNVTTAANASVSEGPSTAPGATGVPTTAPGAPTGLPTTAPGAIGAPTTAPGAPTGVPTTAPGATGAPTTIQTTTPFVSNGTVDTLTTNITRDSCKKTQFCASEPSSCSPSSDSCYFVSAAQASGQAFSFQLNGPSTGYIAMGLASSAAQSSNITTYVCANRNGIFKFFTTYLNNGQLMMTTLPVNKVKGSVRGKLLQCAFTALLPSVTSKSADTSFIVSMSNGNFVNDTLGTPVVQLRSSEVVDLSNPNTTVTNNLNATSAPTTVATTANHGITLQRSLSQALLILFGVLGMALL